MVNFWCIFILCFIFVCIDILSFVSHLFICIFYYMFVYCVYFRHNFLRRLGGTPQGEGAGGGRGAPPTHAAQARGAFPELLPSRLWSQGRKVEGAQAAASLTPGDASPEGSRPQRPGDPAPARRLLAVGSRLPPLWSQGLRLRARAQAVVSGLAPRARPG